MENEINTEVEQSAPEQSQVESSPVVEQSQPEQKTEKVDTRSAAEKAFDTLAAEDEAKPAETQTKQEAITKGLDPTRKGPQAWSPEMREKFSSFDEDTKTYLLKRETEFQQQIQRDAESRKISETVQNIINPYTPFLKSINTHPLEAIRSTLNTAYTLMNGDMNTKAATVAAIIRNNKVDLQAIDDALAGTAPKEQDPVMRELNELKQKIYYQENTAKQQVYQSVETEIQTFASDPHNEFFSDVANDMQILLANNRAETLQDAYDKACYMNPEVRRVIESRQRNPSADIETKINASSTVKGAPNKSTVNLKPKYKSSREATEAAYDAIFGKGR